MRTPCTHYSLYQRFFNTCLREWYFQRDGGAGFYYANPPGLLFTPLRTSRLQKDTFSAPMSHWYFKLPLDGDRFNRTSPLKSDVFGSSSVLQEPNAVESILHIGYDLWYSKVLGAHVSKYTDVYHVSFCNYYDVAFNTLYNVGRNLSVSPEDFDTFQNFRLLTGNIFNMHSILTEPFFKCVILSVSIQK
ncbi:uncharacterized protein BXIN_2910 [Babesia sp. Xinjiang]|uniref:uncharacterized protein n=1 Tax=Babesia sp. Xinjiang TaxID=462227 RepID=UPI000A23B38F|nr:uncharacterized protein BXIN_2910 [Babesia sp. Xinjiang]ORM39596.1 hypothetical protein BXIN_2910 [Babesia sp. Xinjiang]